MKVIARIFQLIYFFYAAVLYIAIMIPVALFAVSVTPLGVIRGGNLIYNACRLWAAIWFPLIGIFHRNIYKEPPGDKAYIFISNHISWLDACLLFRVFERPLRALGKVEVTKVPVFGLIYGKMVVAVDRSSVVARQRSVLRMKSALRKGISILIFPEGTFNETHEILAPFYDGAFRIAIETATPLKPVLFLDSYSRMPYERSLSLNPGRSRAVFLEEIPVAGLTKEDVPALKEKARKMMTDELLAYGAPWADQGKHQ